MSEDTSGAVIGVAMLFGIVLLLKSCVGGSETSKPHAPAPPTQYVPIPVPMYASPQDTPRRSSVLDSGPGYAEQKRKWDAGMAMQDAQRAAMAAERRAEAQRQELLKAIRDLRPGPVIFDGLGNPIPQRP